MRVVRKLLSTTMIGWINGDLIYPVLMPSDWLGKTIKGLKATANPPPPETLSNIQGFIGKRHYRSIVRINLALSVDTQTKELKQVEFLSKFLDEGWTPPYRSTVPFDLELQQWAHDVAGVSKEESAAIRDRRYYRGELAPSSYVAVNDALKSIRLFAQTDLDVKANEKAIARGMIKFRAGAHTDNVGFSVIKCPYHVPWTWGELLLTYRLGKIQLLANCATFPCFSFYFHGDVLRADKRVGTLSLKPSDVLANIKSGSTALMQPSEASGVMSIGPPRTHANTIERYHLFSATTELLL